MPPLPQTKFLEMPPSTDFYKNSILIGPSIEKNLVKMHTNKLTKMVKQTKLKDFEIF